MKTVEYFTKILIFLLVLTFHNQTLGQSKCFSNDEVSRIVNLINSSSKIAENNMLRNELLKMQKVQQQLNQKITSNWEKNQDLVNNATEIGEKHLLQLCNIIKQNGWINKRLVGEDGLAAGLFLIRNNKAFELRKEFLPILVAAAQKGEIDKSNLASLIDKFLIDALLPQVFGTQMEVKDELFYLYPLRNENKVDEWRRLYNLPPLALVIKDLEIRHRMPVVKSPRPPLPLKPVIKNQSIVETKPEINSLLDLNVGEEEIIKVESNLINLNIRVFTSSSTATENLVFQKSDFAIFEDGKKQAVSFFSTNETPFDLILLLDLSGSTAGKHDLIRKSTKRFIETARPSDRIAIITFTDEVRIISDLTQDREKLFKSASKIGMSGGSKVWDALQFTYDNFIKTQSMGKRSAIVFMTDGVDTSLIQNTEGGAWGGFSKTTYTDLLEVVRNNDTTVIPIYLDTETLPDGWVRKAYRQARRTLKIFAEESGGQMFYAEKVEDLNGIYEKITNNLGRVYSLGYETSVERDGSWHSLDVKVMDRPNLIIRTKKGYYAK